MRQVLIIFLFVAGCTATLDKMISCEMQNQKFIHERKLNEK